MKSDAEIRAKIKSYYSQELLDGVKDIDLRKLADDVWNIMNHIPIKTKQESVDEGKRMKTTREIVRAIIASFNYNRSREDMIKLCEEVKKRIRNDNVEWTDDGNIFYGMLVILYGDYGTSPRGGWLESDTEEIIASINEGIEMLKESEE